MKSEIAYMLGIVAVGFAVNYLLRALPFILFAGRDRALPKWVERLGGVISPIIIAALVVYSYSGLAWRSAWPYLAGALTVVLHLWKRNALVSIVAGTVLYMCLLNCGCASRRVLVLDARNPAFRIAAEGVLFLGEPIAPEEAPGCLADYEIPKDRTIHISLDPETSNRALAEKLMGALTKSGYNRPVLVTKRHAEARSVGKKRLRPPSPGQAAKPDRPTTIRYKRADE